MAVRTVPDGWNSLLQLYGEKLCTQKVYFDRSHIKSALFLLINFGLDCQNLPDQAQLLPLLGAFCPGFPVRLVS